MKLFNNHKLKLSDPLIYNSLKLWWFVACDSSWIWKTRKKKKKSIFCIRYLYINKNNNRSLLSTENLLNIKLSDNWRVFLITFSRIGPPALAWWPEIRKRPLSSSNMVTDTQVEDATKLRCYHILLNHDHNIVNQPAAFLTTEVSFWRFTLKLLPLLALLLDHISFVTAGWSKSKQNHR